MMWGCYLGDNTGKNLLSTNGNDTLCLYIIKKDYQKDGNHHSFGRFTFFNNKILSYNLKEDNNEKDYIYIEDSSGVVIINKDKDCSFYSIENGLIVFQRNDTMESHYSYKNGLLTKILRVQRDKNIISEFQLEWKCGQLASIRFEDTNGNGYGGDFFYEKYYKKGIGVIQYLIDPFYNVFCDFETPLLIKRYYGLFSENKVVGILKLTNDWKLQHYVIEQDNLVNNIIICSTKRQDAYNNHDTTQVVYYMWK